MTSNIIDNSFAEERIDFNGFDITVEGNLVRDFNLTIPFAKKLCMTSKSARGEQVRDYVEERAVDLGDEEDCPF